MPIMILNALRQRRLTLGRCYPQAVAHAGCGDVLLAIALLGAADEYSAKVSEPAEHEQVHKGGHPNDPEYRECRKRDERHCAYNTSSSRPRL